MSFGYILLLVAIGWIVSPFIALFIMWRADKAIKTCQTGGTLWIMDKPTVYITALRLLKLGYFSLVFGFVALLEWIEKKGLQKNLSLTQSTAKF